MRYILCEPVEKEVEWNALVRLAGDEALVCEALMRIDRYRADVARLVIITLNPGKSRAELSARPTR